jgi:hypothetical protein
MWKMTREERAAHRLSLQRDADEFRAKQKLHDEKRQKR